MALQPFPGFIGPTAYGSAQERNTERTVNFYLEVASGGENPKTQYALVGTPCLGSYASYTGQSPNAMVTAQFTVGGVAQQLDRTFFIAGVNPAGTCYLYELVGATAATQRATLPIYTHAFAPWKIVASPTQLLVIGNGGGCIIDPQSYAITNLDNITSQTAFPSGLPWPGAVDACFQDGYFIVVPNGSQSWYISNYQDGTKWNALDYALENDAADTLVACTSFRREVWIFGANRTEIWDNTGNNNFPFQRNNAASIKIGCSDAKTVQTVGNNLIWVGRTREGDISVFRANGYLPQRISTTTIDSIIRAAAITNGAGMYANAFTWKGHDFYALSITQQNVTFLYDATTGAWTEWSDTPNLGTYNMHRAQSITFNQQLRGIFVADRNGPNIFLLNDQNSDGGLQIVRTRIAPHSPGFGKRNFYSRFLLDGTTSATYYLNWADATDATPPVGQNTPNPIGAGERIEWRRLGSSYNNRVWRLDVLASTSIYYNPVVINGAWLDIA